MSESLTLLAVLVALLLGLAAGKAWERYKLREGRWIDRQLGPERARTSFPFRALLDAGAIVTFGSGWLDRGSPIDGMYAAVTRRTLDGLHPQGWVPHQRLTVEEALASPHVLVGSTGQCVETLLAWRERWGLSYIGLSEDAMVEFAPVVDALAGV